MTDPHDHQPDRALGWPPPFGPAAATFGAGGPLSGAPTAARPDGALVPATMNAAGVVPPTAPPSVPPPSATLPPPPPPPVSRPPSKAPAIGLLVLLAAVAVWKPTVFAVVAALIAMITLHELGHYLTAKRAGMKVTEFFLGFGPRLWSVRRGETEYGIKAFPLGAYVKVIGMYAFDEIDPAEEDRTYRSKPTWQRVRMASAGSAMHFLLALALLFVAIFGWGIQRDDHWVVGALSKLSTGASPAEKAGLQLGDRIVAIDGVATPRFADAVTIIRAKPEQQVTLTVERKGKQFTTSTTLANRNPSTQEQGVGFLGIGAEHPYVRSGFVASIGDTIHTYGDAFSASVKGLGTFFSPGSLRKYVDTVTSGPQRDPVSGQSTDNGRPVSVIGVVRLGSESFDAGAAGPLWFFAWFNVFIGVFNLVPLLPFDGGHIAIALYEKARSRGGKRYQVNVLKLLPITYAVVAVLGALFLTSAYLDLASLF